MNAVDGDLFRITCTCTTPEHIVDFHIDDNLLWMYTYEPLNKFTFLYRIKKAVKVLLGKPVFESEIVVDPVDLKELVGFLEDKGVI